MLKIAEDPNLAEDILTDHSRMKSQVIIQYIYKTLILISNMVLGCYFLGILYYVFADIFRTRGQDNFIIFYEVNNLPPV